MARKTNKETTETVKTRKAYPDRDARIAMANAKIERLEKLNAERRDLVEKTEAKLNARKTALARSEADLAKVLARRERLTAAKNRPEGAAAARAARNEEKAKIELLKAKLAAQGKTIEDLLKEN